MAPSAAAVSFAIIQSSNAARRTSFLRPIKIAGNARTPSTFAADLMLLRYGVYFAATFGIKDASSR